MEVISLFAVAAAAAITAAVVNLAKPEPVREPKRSERPPAPPPQPKQEQTPTAHNRETHDHTSAREYASQIRNHGRRHQRTVETEPQASDDWYYVRCSGLHPSRALAYHWDIVREKQDGSLFSTLCIEKVKDRGCRNCDIRLPHDGDVTVTAAIPVDKNTGEEYIATFLRYDVPNKFCQHGFKHREMQILRDNPNATLADFARIGHQDRINSKPNR